jgi:transglutaminase-like putative cysteine protease
VPQAHDEFFDDRETLTIERTQNSFSVASFFLVTMRLSINHTTTYDYESPVKSLIQLLRLVPHDHDGQHIVRWRLNPSVNGHLDVSTDAYGNTVHTFIPAEAFVRLTLEAIGELETTDLYGVIRGCREPCPVKVFLRSSLLTQLSPMMQEFAQKIASKDVDSLARLHALTTGIHDHIRFDTNPTDVTTPAAEAFAQKHGVCQDMAHIFLACARFMGLPARYVSGYFHRNDGVNDQEAGHAWVEGYVEGLGWVGFDPANGISTTPAHVRVAVGIDYLSASPVRGARTGGGKETLHIRVLMKETMQ